MTKKQILNRLIPIRHAAIYNEDIDVIFDMLSKLIQELENDIKADN